MNGALPVSSLGLILLALPGLPGAPAP